MLTQCQNFGQGGIATLCSIQDADLVLGLQVGTVLQQQRRDIRFAIRG